MSSVFEPDVVLVLLKNSASGKAKPNFEKDWKSNVSTAKRRQNINALITFWSQIAARVESWKKNRPNQSCYEPQLAWAASIVEYANFIHQATKVPKNAKDKSPRKLSKDIPLFGPQFLPPTLAHRRRRQGTGLAISPASSYLRPLLIVHVKSASTRMAAHASTVGLPRAPSFGRHGRTGRSPVSPQFDCSA